MPDVDDVNKYVKNLSDNVESLQGTADSINKELKRLRKRTTTDKVFNMLVCLSLLGVFLIGLTSLQEVRRDRKTSESSNSGLSCVIEMLEEHRFAQRSAHQAQAKHEGYVYDIPEELSAPSQIEIEALKKRLADKCARLVAP